MSLVWFRLWLICMVYKVEKCLLRGSIGTVIQEGAGRVLLPYQH